jgi:hypothetical protein
MGASSGYRLTTDCPVLSPTAAKMLSIISGSASAEMFTAAIALRHRCKRESDEPLAANLVQVALTRCARFPHSDTSLMISAISPPQRFRDCVHRFGKGLRLGFNAG